MYLGPLPNHARSVVLILNPCTGHVSPQFHVKFDDFFETVGDKSTDFDAPDPEWKYLSGFAVRKDRAKPNSPGLIDRLITPRRGPVISGSNQPSNSSSDLFVDQQQDQTDPVMQDESTHHQEVAIPDTQPPTMLTQQQTDQTSPPIRQTHSGRVIRNTPR